MAQPINFIATYENVNTGKYEKRALQARDLPTAVGKVLRQELASGADAYIPIDAMHNVYSRKGNVQFIISVQVDRSFPTIP